MSATATFPSPAVSGGLGTLAGLGLCGFALVGFPADALAQLRYTASGGGIDGSLGSISFLDADWSIELEADPEAANFITFTFPPVGTFEIWQLPDVLPRVRIRTSIASLSAALLPDPAQNLRWSVISGNFPVGPTPKIGFVNATPDFLTEHAAGLFGVPGLFMDLQQPVSFTGPSVFEESTYRTDQGDLVIRQARFLPGSFTIRTAPVPSPLPVLGLGIGLHWSRRLRQRIRAASPHHRPEGQIPQAYLR